MSSLLAITARELRLRWTLLPAALSLGFVPLLAPVFGFTFAEPGFVGLVLSLLMGALAALLTGVSVIGGDLGSGRLGFFFSRPLPWWAIWGGKLLAAVLLTLGAGLLAAIPWLGWGRGGSLRLTSLWDPRGAVLALSLVLLLVGVGHAASVAFRSRSAWLLVDLGLVAALVLLIRAFGDLMLLAGFALAPGHERTALQFLTLPIGLALLAAGAAQMAWGRTDLRRGHLALSVSLWSMLFLAIGSLAGLGFWVKSAKPGDLRRVVFAQVAPQGDWIRVTGAARGRGGYTPAFLYDTATGRYVRLDWWGFALSFSPRGDRAVGVQFDPWGRHPAGILRLVDLADRTPETAFPRLELAPLAGWVKKLAFGPAGDRLAVVQQRALSIFELPSGRLLGSAPAGSGEWLQDAVFLDDNRLRVLRRSGDQGAVVQIVEIRLPGGQTEVTGQLAAGVAARTAWDDAGERLLVSDQTTPESVTLHDGRSGSLLATLSEPGTRRSAYASFLSDGRIAIASAEGGRSLLRVCRRDGTEERRLQLGPGWGLLGGEPEPGRLYVGLRGAPSQSHTVLVDLDRGSILHREEGLLPAVQAPVFPRPRPGTSGATLFVSDDGELLRLDPTTGQRTVLLGRRGGN